MVPFKLFLERKLRNPLRKKELSELGTMNYDTPEFFDNYKEYIKTTNPEDFDNEDFVDIRQEYDKMRKVLPPRAEQMLDRKLKEYIFNIKHRSMKPYKKIYEFRGVQVFLDDKNVPETQNYEQNSYNYRIVNHCIRYMLNYIRDILPNRHPKILITDVRKETGEEYPAFEQNKTIFVDWRHVDEPKYYVHEYAHWLADLIPSQSSVMLQKSFNEMLDEYFRSMKKKRLPLEKITPAIRSRIAKKLGFPDDYGLLNSDELFAVIIEYWKELPNNPTTYKFKSLVKQVINRI